MQIWGHEEGKCEAVCGKKGAVYGKKVDRMVGWWLSEGWVMVGFLIVRKLDRLFLRPAVPIRQTYSISETSSLIISRY